MQPTASFNNTQQNAVQPYTPGPLSKLPSCSNFSCFLVNIPAPLSLHDCLLQILCNFGVDVLEALSSTCTLFCRHRTGAAQLASDAAVAFILVTAHGAVLMCQAIVFAVAMNSKRNALLALLIASNFVELKGNIYKRTDTNKLWSLACLVSSVPVTCISSCSYHKEDVPSLALNICMTVIINRPLADVAGTDWWYWSSQPQYRALNNV